MVIMATVRIPGRVQSLAHTPAQGLVLTQAHPDLGRMGRMVSVDSTPIALGLKWAVQCLQGVI